MTGFITKEMLEKCIIDTDEKYTIGYSYAEEGIHICVMKVENTLITVVGLDVISWPTLDEITIVQEP